MIPVLGIEGASIATLMGYVVSDVVCVIVLCRMKLMVISKRFIIASLIMTAFMFAWRLFLCTKTVFATIAAMFVAFLMVVLYHSELQKMISILKNRRAKT